LTHTFGFSRSFINRLDHHFGGYEAYICAGPCNNQDSGTGGNSVLANTAVQMNIVPTAPFTQAQQVVLIATTTSSSPTGLLTIQIGG